MCVQQLFINIIRSLHENTTGQVMDCEASANLDITNGTKQGCVPAALLFSIFFAMMLLVAFRDCDLGIPVRFHIQTATFSIFVDSRPGRRH